MEIAINSAISIAAQTVVSLYANIPIKLGLFVITVLFCFAGYKLLRWVSALYGVVLGVMLGACVTCLFPTSMTQIANLIMTILAMVVLGMIFGILCFCFYPIGIFFACACIGAAIIYVPALLVAGAATAVFWAILAVCAALFGVTGVLFLRQAGILTTSLFGFAASFILMDLIGSENWSITIAVGLGLTVAGCVVQLMTNRNMDTLLRARGKRQSDLIAGEVKRDTNAHLRMHIPEEDGVSDVTQVLDLNDLPQEESDESCSVSDAVAEHIRTEQTEWLSPTEAIDVKSLWSEETQAGEGSAEEPVDEPDVPLEQQEKFAWLKEPRVEAPGQDDMISQLWDADKMRDKEADDAFDVATEQNKENPLTGHWNDVMAPSEEPEQPEAEDDEIPQLEEAIADGSVPSEDSDEQKQPTEGLEPEPIVKEPVVGKRDMEPSKPGKHGTLCARQVLWPVLLTGLALLFAAIGIQYVEIALALCFMCYVLRYYRVTAFACAVLCVRRIVDVVLSVMHNDSWISIGLDILSALIFLALTFAAVWAYFVARHAPGHETEE